MEKLKICITGSSGFIGSHLITKLKKNNDIEVIPFEGDLLVKNDIEKFFNLHKDIDQIVHLAGAFFGDLEYLYRINVLATYNLLEVASKHKISKIIYTSTGAVYGEPANGCSVENDNLNPSTIYGLTKKFAEECIYYFAENYGAEYTILRFSNVYGPGNEKGVIDNFLKAIKKDKKITILGTGGQKRNFLFVADAVESLYDVLKYKGKNDIFNIADNKVYNLNEIVAILKDANLDFNVEYGAADIINSLQVLSEDITKAKKMLDWEPSVDIADGINQALRALR